MRCRSPVTSSNSVSGMDNGLLLEIKISKLHFPLLTHGLAMLKIIRELIHLRVPLRFKWECEVA